ncbi:hypothetical protein MNV49_007410 [Pseudohyphozyma bogoriensis]|nr:hypothetical protein MNV49_007410 [Pseudohyphozyma bogoriensis]
MAEPQRPAGVSPELQPPPMPVPPPSNPLDRPDVAKDHTQNVIGTLSVFMRDPTFKNHPLFDKWKASLDESFERFKTPPKFLSISTGQSGAGKSTGGNCLVGQRIFAASGSQACTAAAVRASYNPEPTCRAEVFFMKRSDWSDKLEAMYSTLKGDEPGKLSEDEDAQDNFKFLSDVFPSFTEKTWHQFTPAQLSDLTEWPASDGDVVEFSETSDSLFMSRLEPFISNLSVVKEGKGQTGFELADLPGAGDTSKARMAKGDELRAESEPAKDALKKDRNARGAMRGELSNVTLVVTRMESRCETSEARGFLKLLPKNDVVELTNGKALDLDKLDANISVKRKYVYLLSSLLPSLIIKNREWDSLAKRISRAQKKKATERLAALKPRATYLEAQCNSLIKQRDLLCINVRSRWTKVELLRQFETKLLHAFTVASSDYQALAGITLDYKASTFDETRQTGIPDLVAHCQWLPLEQRYKWARDTDVVNTMAINFDPIMPRAPELKPLFIEAQQALDKNLLLKVEAFMTYVEAKIQNVRDAVENARSGVARDSIVNIFWNESLKAPVLRGPSQTGNQEAVAGWFMRRNGDEFDLNADLSALFSDAIEASWTANLSAPGIFNHLESEIRAVLLATSKKTEVHVPDFLKDLFTAIVARATSRLARVLGDPETKFWRELMAINRKALENATDNVADYMEEAYSRAWEVRPPQVVNQMRNLLFREAFIKDDQGRLDLYELPAEGFHEQ